MGYTQHVCRALWKWAGRGAGRLSYPQVLLPPGDTPLGVMLPALSTRAHQRDFLFNRPAVERRRHRIMGIHRAQAPAHDVEPALVIHLKVIRALLLALEKEQVGVSALEPPSSYIDLGRVALHVNPLNALEEESLARRHAFEALHDAELHLFFYAIAACS